MSLFLVLIGTFLSVSVANGPKDMVKDEEFESWRNQPHQVRNT